MDWPVDVGAYAPHVMVHTYGPWSGIAPLAVAATLATNAWPAANRAILTPIRLSATFRAVRGYWINGSAVAGTVDVGIYTPDGTLLTSTGPTSQATTNIPQGAAFSSAVTLAPGLFYLALLASSASANFFQSGVNVAWSTLEGMAQNAVGSGTLPSTITFATPASALIPFIGMTSGSTP